MCQEFHLVNFTVRSIWKNIDKIFSLLEKMNNELSDYGSLNELTLMRRWLEQQRIDNVPVSGPAVMVKAEQLAKLLNGEECAGWIDRPNVRHNIS